MSSVRQESLNKVDFSVTHFWIYFYSVSNKAMSEHLITKSHDNPEACENGCCREIAGYYCALRL